MDGHFRDGAIRVAGDARQRYYDASGYGRPLSGNEIELSRVEAAHLLYRDDLDSIDGMDFREFFVEAAGADDGRFGVRFLVYADLRRRGFYLSPARDGWVADPQDDVDFVVYPRGKGPSDGDVLYTLRVAGERETIPASTLGDRVLAVVDEESDITYLETDRPEISGSSTADLPADVRGTILPDRVLVWDPPVRLHERAFYGQPFGDDGPLQLSFVEAAHLAARGVVAVDGGYDAVVERGRDVEGERFDRRLRAYAALRERGVVPKTGFKFGADFRSYADVDSIEDLGHSELLVRVVRPDHAFALRDLALDVRLAHGVRKEMVFALVGEESVSWLSVGRLTP